MKDKKLKLTGENAKKVLEEIQNPKPLSKKQVELFDSVLNLSKNKHKQQTIKNILSLIEQNELTEEELEMLKNALNKN